MALVKRGSGSPVGNGSRFLYSLLSVNASMICASLCLVFYIIDVLALRYHFRMAGVHSITLRGITHVWYCR